MGRGRRRGAGAAGNGPQAAADRDAADNACKGRARGPNDMEYAHLLPAPGRYPHVARWRPRGRPVPDMRRAAPACAGAAPLHRLMEGLVASIGRSPVPGSTIVVEAPRSRSSAPADRPPAATNRSRTARHRSWRKTAAGHSNVGRCVPGQCRRSPGQYRRRDEVVFAMAAESAPSATVAAPEKEDRPRRAARAPLDQVRTSCKLSPYRC